MAFLDTLVFVVLTTCGVLATFWAGYNLYHLLAYLATRHRKEVGGSLPAKEDVEHQGDGEATSVVPQLRSDGEWTPDANIDYPMVTVQATAYNELDCIDNLLRCLPKLQWPKDRLQIQLLDDSTLPEAVKLADRVIKDVQRQHGITIEHCRREHRIGYKAGNLLHHFPSIRGDYVAIFDSDFLPYPDFLLRTIPHFFDANGDRIESVGLVQTTWDHHNQTDNLFTQVQGLVQNFHFIIQQNVRYRRCEFFPFNGTAGVWKTEAIRKSGNWNYDTVTEDLDMACRAKIQGYDFVFLEHVAVPSELPPSMMAYKRQQRRWTQGHMQVCRKIIRAMWRSPFTLVQKIDLTHILCYKLDWIFGFASILVLPLLGFVNLSQTQYLIIAVFGINSTVLWFVIMLVTLFDKKFMNPEMSTWQRMRRAYVIPFFIILHTGVTFWQFVSVLEGLIQNDIPFATTPKAGKNSQLDERKLEYMADMDDAELVADDDEGEYKELHFEGWNNESANKGSKMTQRRRKPGPLSKSFPHWAHFVEFLIGSYMSVVGFFYHNRLYAIPMIFLASGFFWVAIPGIRSSIAKWYAGFHHTKALASNDDEKDREMDDTSPSSDDYDDTQEHQNEGGEDHRNPATVNDGDR